MTAADPARVREAQRQRLLLRVLHNRATTLPVTLWMAEQGARAAAGLKAYRDHAVGQAARSLGVAFPTVAELVGEEALATMARLLWLQSPPRSGDLADWGEGLPAFIEASDSLADVPYLADVARLDWAVHRAARAEDLADAPPALQALLDHDPADCRLRFVPGSALVRSAHPIVMVRAAHRRDDADRFATVREAFASGVAEAAWVWRTGFEVQVQALSPAEADFHERLLAGACLGPALEAATDAFDFGCWLPCAVQAGWLRGAEAVHPTAFDPS